MWTSVLKWNPGCLEIMIVCMCNWRCFVVLQESCNSSNFTTQKSEWYKCMKDQCHLNARFCNMRSHLSNCNGTAHVCHTECEKNPLLFFHKPAIAVCMSLHHVTCQPSDLHIFFSQESDCNFRLSNQDLFEDSKPPTWTTKQTLIDVNESWIQQKNDSQPQNYWKCLFLGTLFLQFRSLAQKKTIRGFLWKSLICQTLPE